MCKTLKIFAPLILVIYLSVCIVAPAWGEENVKAQEKHASINTGYVACVVLGVVIGAAVGANVGQAGLPGLALGFVGAIAGGLEGAMIGSALFPEPKETD